MVMNTTLVNKAVATNVTAASAGETLKSIKASIGRTFSKGAHAVKDVAVKVWRAIVDFFKHFPRYITSGYGIGAIGLAAGATLSVIALAAFRENKTSHNVARALLVVGACAFFFTAGAVMFAFGRNPVVLSRLTARAA